MRRGRRTEMPHPGSKPIFTWVSQKLAAVEAIRTSHAIEISKPPVTAGPLMAPMIGPSKRARAAVTSSSKPTAEFRLSPHSCRSRPAVNARPAPVRINTRIAGSVCKASIAEISSVRSSMERAFSFSGRLSVTTA